MSEEGSPEGEEEGEGGDERLAAYLRRAALAYCERYASSEANLTRVLTRKARRRLEERTAKGEERAPSIDPEPAVAAAVAHCRRLGFVDDRAYAETKAAAGRRRGLGASRIAAGLAAKGVDRETTSAAVAADETEARRSALVYARRKRLGPWRRADDRGRDGETLARRSGGFGARDDRTRDMAALCRGGHAPEVARWVVGLDREAAEARLAGEAED